MAKPAQLVPGADSERVPEGYFAAEVPVEKNSQTLLNDSTEPVLLQTAGGKPGSLVDIKFTAGGTNPSQTIKIPVVDTTLPEYAP